jgi:hypothetical protein
VRGLQSAGDHADGHHHGDGPGDGHVPGHRADPYVTHDNHGTLA